MVLPAGASASAGNDFYRSGAAKYLARLNEPDLSRITDAINKLELEPPEGDIKKLTDRDEYRLRVGGYRILFKIEEDIILVTNITTRGHAY